MIAGYQFASYLQETGIPDKPWSIDLKHDGGSMFATQLQSWFHKELVAAGIPFDAIDEASIVVLFGVKGKLDCTCTCKILAQGKTFENTRHFSLLH